MTTQGLNVTLPYCGPAPAPAEWWMRWNADPLLIAGLALGLFLLIAARERRWTSHAALFLFAFLYISPFCAVGSALFSARILHHLLLVTALAPLLARRIGTRWPGSLGVWTVAQAVILWFWHLPVAYAAALSHSTLFWAMQSTILLSATLYWRRLTQARPAARVVALLATMMQMSLLGALISFAPGALYSPHWLTTQSWGLSPLEDQQLAGLIMWIPTGVIYLGLALGTVARMIRVPRYDGALLKL
ncbi:cytochrome c oxidase assembly protein [Sphingobium sp.]|uniref:cytochrome c oxidase assembly protein n=1 Tax=Sphingobium sp. TaxID=1912891 RepID=UPI002BEFB6AC|nr:cytochrome c oxidase assembly protein [Sphingobium sp.]HUD95064.1 cytochrome c oxidase assembly protein [Sphingobium sp.]